MNSSEAILKKGKINGIYLVMKPSTDLAKGIQASKELKVHFSQKNILYYFSALKMENHKRAIILSSVANHLAGKLDLWSLISISK